MFLEEIIIFSDKLQLLYIFLIKLIFEKYKTDFNGAQGKECDMREYEFIIIKVVYYKIFNSLLLYFATLLLNIE